MSVADSNTLIGLRIKQRRKELDITLNDLAALLGFSYQQLQKYESGRSKITADKLLSIAYSMNKSIDFFYQDIVPETALIGDAIKSDFIDPGATYNLNVMLGEDNPGDVMLFSDVANNNSMVDALYIEHVAKDIVPTLREYKMNANKALPNIVFLDINMPDMSGLDVLKAIKADRQLSHIVVIILSGSLNRKQMLKAYRYGAASYVLKTRRGRDYSEEIDNVLNYWSEHVVLPNN